jgi:hypothetical protein
MTTATWVDAGPFRAHLHHLMRTGDLTAREVATLAGISVGAADSLLLGRHGRPVRRISHATALALLDVRPQHAKTLRASQVPADGSRRRLLRLLAEGETETGLAEQLGTVGETVRDLADGTLLWCPALLALRLVTLLRARTTTTAILHPQSVRQQQRAA